MKNNLFVFFVVVFLSSCSPFTKESYMKQYCSFIEDVAEHCNDYSEKDWENIDKKNNKFNNIWFDKFKDDLSFSDRMTITKYQMQYLYYRHKP